MKIKSLLKFLAIVLVSMTFIYGGCNKDDDPAPTPTPTDYHPVFSATYYSVDMGGVDYLDFRIACITDDWEMIKVIVTPPGGGNSMQYNGSGTIMTQNAQFTFTDYFLKLGGTWSFSITGNVKSGTNNGEGFTETVSVSVSGKK